MTIRTRGARLGLLAAFLLLGSAPACGDGGGEMGITDVQPRSGSMSGERPVQILGYNFRTDIGYTVYFGNLRATSVTIISPELILVTTPAREEAGKVDITLLADSGPAFTIGGTDGAGIFEYLTEAQDVGAAGTSMGNLAL